MPLFHSLWIPRDKNGVCFNDFVDIFGRYMVKMRMCQKDKISVMVWMVDIERICIYDLALYVNSERLAKTILYFLKYLPYATSVPYYTIKLHD